MDGPLLIELRTDPLGMLLMVPEGKRYFVAFSVAAAQSLALALLAQPGVGAEIKPELAKAIDGEGGQMAKSDAQFLKTMGVANGN